VSHHSDCAKDGDLFAENAQLRADLATSHARVKQLEADLEEMTEKWERACDHASHQELLKMQAEGPKLEQLWRKAEELTELLRSSPCKSCASARAELRTLTEAWALRELTLPHPQYALEAHTASLPERVRALIRAGAGKPIGECDRCGKRAPLHCDRDKYGVHRRTCCPGWGCSAEKGDANRGE